MRRMGGFFLGIFWRSDGKSSSDADLLEEECAFHLSMLWGMSVCFLGVRFVSLNSRGLLVKGPFFG